MLNSGGEKNIVRKKNSERNKKTHKHPPPPPPPPPQVKWSVPNKKNNQIYRCLIVYFLQELSLIVGF